MLEELWAVVVNWNLPEETIKCVESLVGAGLALERTLVVDNGSTDGSVTALRARFGEPLPVVPNSENRGFARGSNTGIHHVLSNGAQWVLLINNDAYVAPSFLIELERATCVGEGYAIFGPTILYHDAPERVWSLGDRLVPGTLFTSSLYRGRKDPGRLPTLMPVDFVTGCGMLVRRQVFDTIGLFDASVFMYGEDVEFCWQARRAGFRLAVAPHAKMWHKVSTSANRARPSAAYARTRNQNRFYRRHSHWFQMPVMFTLSGLRVLSLALVAAARGESALRGPLLQGWLDGWMGHGAPKL